MVFCRDHDVFHAGIFRNPYPGIRIVFYRVELLCESLVFGYWNFSTVHDPFSNAINLMPIVSSRRNRIYPPMDEHAKTGFAPPLHSFLLTEGLNLRYIACLSG